MPISQTTITGSFKTPANQDAQLTGITFKLSGSDTEAGETIAANTVTGAVVTPQGDFSVTLWPNDKGMEGSTTYDMNCTFADGSSVTHMKKLFVRYSATQKTLEEVAFETKAAGTVKPYSVVVMTQAAYAALTTKAPNTFYAIKG